MLIGLSGFKESGKDSTALVLTEELGFYRVALADPVRDVAIAIDPYVPWQGLVERLSRIVNEIGWDCAKREIPEVRRLLQAIGTEAGRNLLDEDLWINKAEEIHNSQFANLHHWQFKNESLIVITDVRLDNECKWILRHNGEIWWIDRLGLEISDMHITEAGIPKKYASRTILNHGTLEDLRFEVRDAFTKAKETRI